MIPPFLMTRRTESLEHLPGSLLGLGVDLDVDSGRLLVVDGKVLDRHVV
jgi:hypothetical protein